MLLKEGYTCCDPYVRRTFRDGRTSIYLPSRLSNPPVSDGVYILRKIVTHEGVI